MGTAPTPAGKCHPGSDWKPVVAMMWYCKVNRCKVLLVHFDMIRCFWCRIAREGTIHRFEDGGDKKRRMLLSLIGHRNGRVIFGIESHTRSSSAFPRALLHHKVLALDDFSTHQRHSHHCYKQITHIEEPHLLHNLRLSAEDVELLANPQWRTDTASL